MQTPTLIDLLAETRMNKKIDEQKKAKKKRIAEIEKQIKELENFNRS